MYTFRGNTATSQTSPDNNNPALIENFLIVNKEAGAITFNVYLIDESTSISVSPLNKSLSAGDVYESQRAVVLLPTENIKVETSGSIDYDFNISDLTP